MEHRVLTDEGKEVASVTAHRDHLYPLSIRIVKDVSVAEGLKLLWCLTMAILEIRQR